MSRQSKVRTGCSVCKTRRVKCDETKPFCTRCTSTGRTCEGYAPPLPRKSRTRRSKYDIVHLRRGQSADVRSAISKASLVLDSSGSGPAYAWGVPGGLDRARNGVDQDESRSLDYYRMRVSQNISSYFDADFWNSLVLQVGEREPAVRHAVLALSALYEAGEASRLLRPRSLDQRYNYLTRFAIYEYTKAIGALLNRTNTDGPLLEVTMMSCLIFTWVEFLRDSVEDALGHLRSGLRILCEQQQSIGSRAVVKQMAHIMGRTLIQATLHGSSTMEFDYHAIVGYSPGAGSVRFATLRQARCNIDGKINRILCFLLRIEGAGFAELCHVCCASSDLLCLRCVYESHVYGLGQWEIAFDSLRDRLDISTLTADALQALHQLELSYLLISNTLDTLFATTPMVFDRYNDIYARMLHLGRRILQNQILRRSNPPFTLPFDNNVHGALFYVAVRCRHLPVRREAARLLQRCSDYEGVWQCTSLVAFCNWKIDIEEQGRPEGALESDTLPESARVYAEKARQVVRDGREVVAIHFKRGGPSGSGNGNLGEEEVPNVSMRPGGLLGT